jgi:hypothetical protein
VGVSYEGLLVADEKAAVRAALQDLQAVAVIAPVGPGRTAVILQEGRWNYADVGRLALDLSGRFGFTILTHEVGDSDVVFLDVFQHGRRIHRYVSDLGMLGSPIETDEGIMVEIDGVLYPDDAASLPRGPRGDDPEVFVPFGVGTVDQARLATALRGELDEDTMLFAEQRHWKIIEALNLEAAPLTRAFRHTSPSELNEAELVGRPA